MRHGLLALAVVTVTVAAGEPLSVSYVAYDVSSDTRVELFRGTRTYAPSDIVTVRRSTDDGRVLAKKSLDLQRGFRIGVSDFLPQTGEGIGLWLSKDDVPQGFSWEWFSSRSGDGVFTKLQGAGRVRITSADRGNGMEITRIDFLSDTDLRFKGKPGPRTADSHVITVKAGSVLQLAP